MSDKDKNLMHCQVCKDEVHCCYFESNVAINPQKPELIAKEEITVSLESSSWPAEYHYKCPRCGTSSRGSQIYFDANSRTFNISKEGAIKLAADQWNRMQSLIAKGELSESTTTRSKSL